MYIIYRRLNVINDKVYGDFVPESGSGYTKDLNFARKFETLEEAKAEACNFEGVFNLNR